MEEILGPLFPALCEQMLPDRNLDCTPKHRLRQGQGQGERQGQVVPGDPVKCSRVTSAPARVEPVDVAISTSAAIYAMAKLCLRQETELSELRQEKSLLLHISAGPHGILKQLIQASLKWNELRDQLKVDCSLKSELFRLMLKETAARMEKFEQTPESIAAAEKAKWVTTQPLTWLYQVWDPVAHILIHDPSRQGIPHQEVKALLETMREALKQDPAALNQFTAKRKLTDNMSGASVAFKVTVGLRSPQCQTLYAAFAKLAGLSILQLIAANMHKERQKHGREAEEVRNLTWRYGSGSQTHRALTHATSIPPFCS